MEDQIHHPSPDEYTKRTPDPSRLPPDHDEPPEPGLVDHDNYSQPGLTAPVGQPAMREPADCRDPVPAPNLTDSHPDQDYM
jgi:hypothetical protein